METNKALFGELLRDWRVETLGLTLQDFVKELNKCGFTYSFSTIAKYEQGVRRPNGEFLAHLSICFSLPREEVISWLEALSIEYFVTLQDQYTAVVQARNT